MMMVYVAVGSNDAPEKHIQQGLGLLREVYGDLVVSPFYVSGAVGQGGADYYNGVVAFETQDTPETIKQRLVVIEDACGRVRRDEHGVKSRRVTLDCDILLYGDAILTYDGREIPHADIVRFAFVAVPLAMIHAGGVHPQTGERFVEIAGRIGDAGLAVVRGFEP